MRNRQHEADCAASILVRSASYPRCLKGAAGAPVGAVERMHGRDIVPCFMVWPDAARPSPRAHSNPPAATPPFQVGTHLIGCAQLSADATPSTIPSSARYVGAVWCRRTAGS